MIQLEERPPRKILESTVLRRCLVAVSRLPGVVAARNNTGKSPIACAVCRHRLCQRCAMRLAYPIPFGLGEGGPDIVGLITMCPALPIAVAFGLECKTPHGRKKHPEILRKQQAWRLAARRRGMLVEQVTCADEAIEAVESFRVEYTRRLLVLA